MGTSPCVVGGGGGSVVGGLGAPADEGKLLLCGDGKLSVLIRFESGVPPFFCGESRTFTGDSRSQTGDLMPDSFLGVAQPFLAVLPPFVPVWVVLGTMGGSMVVVGGVGGLGLVGHTSM